MTSASADVVILGAGAAGLMCALTAGRRGRRVVVLDHARQPGEKILISGGGRCNFTNLHCRPDRFLSANPHFCRSALARYTPQDFLGLVERHRIAWHEKTVGQLFCDGSARQIVAMLLAECNAVGVDIRLGQRIGEVSRGDRFRVDTAAGSMEASSLVLATGGLSIPKIGATGLSHDLARRFGLALTAIRPGLVPLLLGGEDHTRIADLAGVSANVGASCGRTRFEDGMVVTHRGLSGPAILQISSFWREGAAVRLDLLPQAAPGLLRARKQERPKAGLRTVLGEVLPQRLAEAFLPAKMAGRPIGEVADRDLAALEAALHAWEVWPTGTEGYAKAEVTLGGVDTAELSQRTMMAKAVPGLFVIGEAVDVTGWLGGYNFQWAWASGFVAGEVA
ncbi:MAG: NAD(P)/FAD-dependent oxidoreductase [Proteobacteria bacterium]|nr:NAD(P)/FAD-dependent oxidoreductase [Pseudomonadota bacterium]